MYKTQFNAKPFPGQKFTQPSKTIQGQVQSIQKMLERIQAGMPVQYSKMDYTEDDEPMPVFQDLTDLDDAKREIDMINARILERNQKAKATDEIQEQE